MNLDEAKIMVDNGLFVAGTAHHSVLHEKLSYLFKMKIEDDGKKSMDGQFESFFSDGEIKHQENYDSPNCFENTGCSEQGWEWSEVTGPRDVSEYYYYSSVFDKDCKLFVYAYQLYLNLFEGVEDRRARSLVDRVFVQKDTAALQRDLNDASQLYDVYSIFEEMLEYSIFEIEERYDEEGEAEFDSKEYERCVVETLLLSAYYIYLYLSERKMEGKHMGRLEAVLSEVTNGEDAEDYLTYFIEEVARHIPGSDESQKVALPLALNVFFAMYMNEHEMTPTLYVFKSAPMKRYKDLRERFSEHELVPYLDRVVALLEDPAHMTNEAVGFDGYLQSGECCMECKYTSEEYVCAYYYFERAYGQHTGGVRFDYLYSLARKVFAVLFEAFEKSVS